MKKLIGSFLIVFACAAGVSGEDADKPDFASYDKPVLLILVENQYHEIERLRAEIEGLKAKIAAGHGGTDAVVVGDITDIRNGSWDVTIQDVSIPDTTPYEAEIESLRKQLRGDTITADSYGRRVGSSIESRLAEAQRRQQAVMAKGKYKKVVRHNGSTVYNAGNPGGYRDAELREVNTAVTKLERQKKTAERKILNLERRVEVEREMVTAQGVTDDGVLVTIKASGVHAHAGRMLEMGKTYTLTGRGLFNANSGKITLKTAAEVHDEPAGDSENRE